MTSNTTGTTNDPQPYAVPSPYPAPAPSQPGWVATAAPPPGGSAYPFPVVAAAPAAAPSQAPMGLAIGALVTAGLALLVAVGTAAWLMWPVGGGFGEDFDGEYYGGYIQGQVRVTDGAVPGQRLTDELTRQLDLQNGYVDEISCPDTADLEQGSVTVCHGVVEDLDWTGIVFFEDAEGTYFLDERW